MKIICATDVARRLRISDFGFGVTPIDFCVLVFRHHADYSFLRFDDSASRRLRLFVFSAFGATPIAVFFSFDDSASCRLQVFAFWAFGVMPIAVFSVLTFRRRADCGFQIYCAASACGNNL